MTFKTRLCRNDVHVNEKGTGSSRFPDFSGSVDFSVVTEAADSFKS